MKVDSQLMFNVSQKVTGANIHAVSQIECLYGGAIYIYNLTKNKTEKKSWEKDAEKYKSQLEYFVQTGKLQK